MDKRPLWSYVLGVIAAMVFVDYLAWRVGGAPHLHTAMLVSGGFLLGMLAMYIAVHLYRWR